MFTELVTFIARTLFSLHTASENQVREWNSVDSALDRFSLQECDIDGGTAIFGDG